MKRTKFLVSSLLAAGFSGQQDALAQAFSKATMRVIDDPQGVALLRRFSQDHAITRSRDHAITRSRDHACRASQSFQPFESPVGRWRRRSLQPYQSSLVIRWRVQPELRQHTDLFSAVRRASSHAVSSGRAHTICAASVCTRNQSRGTAPGRATGTVRKNEALHVDCAPDPDRPESPGSLLGSS